MTDDIGKQILEEVKSFNRMNKKLSICALVFLSVFIFGYIPYMHSHSGQSQTPPPSNPSWHEVRFLIDQTEYDKAITLTPTLIQKSPNYYYGYTTLGGIYLAKGDFVNAEVNFAKANDLFPTEESEKDLRAVRKVLQSRQGK